MVPEVVSNFYPSTNLGLFVLSLRMIPLPAEIFKLIFDNYATNLWPTKYNNSGRYHLWSLIILLVSLA